MSILDGHVWSVLSGDGTSARILMDRHVLIWKIAHGSLDNSDQKAG
jgi:hypothetical protein